MLTIKNIVEAPEEIIKKLAVKHFDAQEVISQVMALDLERKRAQQAKDTLLSEQKLRAKQIGDLMKKGEKEQAEALRLEVAQLKERSKEEEEKEKEVEFSLRELLLTIPNTPHESVPEGNGAEDNLCVKTGGELPNLKGQ